MEIKKPISLRDALEAFLCGKTETEKMISFDDMREVLFSRSEAMEAAREVYHWFRKNNLDPALGNFGAVCGVALRIIASNREQKNNTAEYILPQSCEMCGSENLYVRVIYNRGITRYGCLDCNWARSLPKQENLKKRTNTSLSHWSENVKAHHPFCAICGSKEKLEAHHIIPVSHDRSYMYHITNGITLCHKCHYLVHNKASE